MQDSWTCVCGLVFCDGGGGRGKKTRRLVMGRGGGGDRENMGKTGDEEEAEAWEGLPTSTTGLNV